MKGKFTILPRRLDQMVKQNIESKKMQVLMTGFLFTMFLCLLVMFTPVFASLGSFFGYPDSTIGTYTEILSGHSAMHTLDQVFSQDVFNEINNMPLLGGIIQVTSILGIAFILLYVGLGIIEAAQHGTLTNEKMIGLLVTFAIPAFLIINFNMLKDTIVKTGTIAKDSIVEEVKASDDYLDEWTVPDINDYIHTPVTDITEFMNGLSSYLQAVIEAAPKVPLHVTNVVSGLTIFNVEDKSFGENLVDRWDQVTQDCNNRWDEIRDSDQPWYGKLWEGLCNIGSTAWGYVSSIGGAIGDEIGELLNKLFQEIADFILMLILICVDIGVRLGIMLSCYGVIGRMVIYQCFLPMSIADIGREGARSNGMRIIKLYFGVFLEIGMFYLINYIGWKVFSILVLQQETVAGLIVCFIGAGAGIRALMKSAKSISERLVGAVG